MDYTEMEEQIISEKTSSVNSVRTLSEEIVDIENPREDGAETPRTNVSNHSVEIEDDGMEIKSKSSKAVSEIENESREMSEKYDEELNSPDYNYVLGTETPVKIKNIFLRKVIFILIIELFISFGGSTLTYLFISTRKFLGAHSYLGLVAFGLILLFGIVAGLKPTVIRSKLTGWIGVPIGIALVTVVLSCLESGLDSPEVMFSHMVVNSALVLSLFFTFQSRVAFTGVYGHLFTLMVFLIGYGIGGIFIKVRKLEYAISAIVGLVIGLYILVELRMVVNGLKKEKYTVKDYGSVIVLLYVDFIVRAIDGIKYVYGKKESTEHKVAEGEEAL